jgi:hypothetical protein
MDAVAGLIFLLQMNMNGLSIDDTCTIVAVTTTTLTSN